METFDCVATVEGAHTVYALGPPHEVHAGRTRRREIVSVLRALKIGDRRHPAIVENDHTSCYTVFGSVEKDLWRHHERSIATERQRVERRTGQRCCEQR